MIPQQSIHTLLVANRGEIALRIMRTCRKMGIRTVAVFSDADRNAPHVHFADTAVFIGSSEVAASYLNQDKLIDAAKRSGANAIHPGYGFLSENAGFARRVIGEGMIWVGPNPDAIEQMGSKSNAKSIAIEHNVPVIPGYKGTDQSEATLISEAQKIGFPLLLKAAAGGGGKGMRIVYKSGELQEAIQGAKREALSSFGSDELLIEKYFPSARHIEIQIFGDKHGNALHLLERECTIQRRYQKIFEESPSPVLKEDERKRMGEAALRMAKALHYDNAGTVEFIYADGDFYFLEVNTRLQVEHPVTEAVTGLDLVEMQIRSAEGHRITLSQSDISHMGYALECRIYAEDPSNGFLPASGTLKEWIPFENEGLRYDSGVVSGSEISIYYDPMISKVIAHGTDRATALRKMEMALRKTVCSGITTNQWFLIQLLQDERFRAGEYDTHFIEKYYPQDKLVGHPEEYTTMALLAALVFKCLKLDEKRTLLKGIPFGWRNNFYQKQSVTFIHADKEHIVRYRKNQRVFEIDINGTSYLVLPFHSDGNDLQIEINGVLEKFRISCSGADYFVYHFNHPQVVLTEKSRFPDTAQTEEKGGYTSPMPASVIKVLVKKGDEVKNGQSLVILSSMKMENTISASEDGTVEDIFISEGENIEAGRVLLKLKANT
jgi:3-methylcrotonyl-CoA carboxylase alpha subunit